MSKQADKTGYVAGREVDGLQSQAPLGKPANDENSVRRNHLVSHNSKAVSGLGLVYILIGIVLLGCSALLYPQTKSYPFGGLAWPPLIACACLGVAALFGGAGTLKRKLWGLLLSLFLAAFSLAVALIGIGLLVYIYCVSGELPSVPQALVAGLFLLLLIGVASSNTLIRHLLERRRASYPSND